MGIPSYHKSDIGTRCSQSQSTGTTTITTTIATTIKIKKRLSTNNSNKREIRLQERSWDLDLFIALPVLCMGRGNFIDRIKGTRVITHETHLVGFKPSAVVMTLAGASNHEAVFIRPCSAMNNR